MMAARFTTYSPDPDRRARFIIWSALLVGVLVRGWLVIQPPAPAMQWDHHEYVAWSNQAWQDGVLSVYSRQPVKTRIWHEAEGVAATPQGEKRRICNYPPLAVYILAGEGRLLHLLKGEIVSNTRHARTLFALPAMAGDLLLAWGCLAVVRLRLKGLAPGLAFAVAFCAPPVFLDSSMWGQTDSWVLAPAVWMLWAMMCRRWFAAGVLWGVAMGLKTQGILLAPLWVFAFLLDPDRRRIAVGGLIGAAVLGAAAVPFIFSSGMDWFREAFLQNVLVSYKLTTLKAFNLWYLDLLLCENDDASRLWLGLEKDLWGKLLLAGGVLVCGLLVALRADGRADRLLRFAGVFLLLAVILPTRVHERYILLPLPFLICLAAADRWLWWGVVPFILAASFQITSLNWMHGGAESWGYVVQRAYRDYDRMGRALPPDEFARVPPPAELLAEQRPRFVRDRRASGDPPKEWGLTLLELAASGICTVLICGRRPRRSAHNSRAVAHPRGGGL